jgi:tryptophanyl-tRNA synthetase
MFRQSQIKEHAELNLIFSMLITVNRLERNPTVKDQARELHIEQIIYGHLGYPVLQAADILLYRGDAVPVGEDQVPHVEISREIARKFNNQYGKVFPEPEPVLTKFARLPGLDGAAKMSKSVGNTILLSDEPEVIKAKLKKAVTDPQKIRRHDPGRPEICLIFSYHKKFNEDEVMDIESGCRSGELGCVECKMNCAGKLSSFLQPIRDKRNYYETHMNEVLDILNDGERRARAAARETMQIVRNAMKFG